MEVKIYREEENKDLILNEDQVLEYNELAAELGIIPIDKAAKNNIPGVYAPLNYAMQRQLQALCPVISEIEKYTHSTIPLEVLKVLQLAKKNNMYDGYQIWYNDVNPDPILIGWNWASTSDKEKNYSWNRKRFLIARWGDCALELPELLKRGSDNLKEQLINKAKIAINTASAVLENPEAYVDAILSNNSDKPRINLNTSADNQIY